MISMMDLDETKWQFFDDNGSVRNAAEAALAQIGWQQRIFSTRIARRRSGSMDSGCIAVWCVDLDGVQPEARLCLSSRDADPEGAMVHKFASTFDALRDALRTGQPFIQVYEGELEASAAWKAFRVLHDGHQTATYSMGGRWFVKRCESCHEEISAE